MATIDEAIRLRVDAVKIHNLYAVRNTTLADQWERGEVQLLGRDEYVRIVADAIERLPESIVVERVSGEAPPKYFLGPNWCLDKPGLLRALQEEFARRDTYQGKRADHRPDPGLAGRPAGH